jgi:hypothetical protein
MREDEKTARGRNGPDSGKPLIVRTTAPAGTPVRRSPVGSPDSALPGRDARGSSPMPALPSPTPSGHSKPGRFHSDRPMDTMTPARTVGGHTARLNIPEGVPEPPLVPEDRAPSSGPVAAPAPSIPVDLPPPASHTVGGTMRMPTVDPTEAAPKAPAAAPPRRGSSASSPDGEGTFGERLLAPISVAVGLVFFAMGSLGTLTVEVRRADPEAKGPAVTPSVASASAAPNVHAAATASAVAPTAPAAPSSAPVATISAPATAATPPPSVRPGVGVRSQGTSRPGGRSHGGVFEPKGD